MKAGLDLYRWHSTGLSRKLAHALVQLERAARGTQLVVVVRRRYAEHGHDLLADRLVHDAAMPPHDINGDVADLCDETIGVGRRHAFDEAAVVRDARHEHRRATTLGNRTRVWRLRERPIGASSCCRRRLAARSKGDQIGGKDCHRRIAIVRELFERPPQHPVKAHGDVRVRGRNQIGSAVEDRLGQRLPIVPSEWPNAGQHLVQEYAERPDIAPLIDGLRPDVLRAHVGEGTEMRIDANRRHVLDRGNAKVENLHSTVTEQHDVRWLDVAMHDAVRVREADTARNLQGDRSRILERHSPPLQASLQRLAVVEWHRQKQLPVVGLADFEDGADVWMVERCRRTRLDEESLLRRRLSAEGRGEELQRDVAAQARVVRLVDNPHPTHIDELQHQVLPDAPSFPSGDLRSRPRGRGRDRGRQSIHQPGAFVRGEQ